MKQLLTLPFLPHESADTTHFKEYISAKTDIPLEDINAYRILKRAIDARQRKIVIHYTFEVFIQENPSYNKPYSWEYKNVSNSKPVIIVGAGPAGLYAALRFIELGIKPIIIERGKAVEERKHDIAAINRERKINPDSNYCFGEGGAGTYSDGKLYTRSTKRGDVQRILHILHEHGASEDILIDTHAHIGTDKLPKIISNIRNTILENGGEILFGQRVTDFIIKGKHIHGVITNHTNEHTATAVILANGHSARDIYELLNNKKILIEPKSFAVGVRIEHPQELINTIQYHSNEINPYLPAASYSLACQSEGKGVFSFCMCPGGSIVTASTSENELVLNGMSNAQRNLPFANAGMVVTVDENDFTNYNDMGALKGIMFQKKLEENAFIAGGSNYTAPAQRMCDFIERKTSDSFSKSSYYNGLKSVALHELLPPFITKRLQEALPLFNKKMKGFLTNEAILLGVETRTSSPIRIPRDKDTLEHIEIAGLFPCGEGSGYSGGIVSSAIDGERCAEQAAKKLNS